MPENNPLLPIKRVLASNSDYKPNPSGGGDFIDPIVEVDSEFLDRRYNELDSIEENINSLNREWGQIPSVGIVKLHKKALAKTKRPTRIFSEKTCPIIGINGLGELFISITPKRLKRLVNRIDNAEDEKDVAQLSTIESIRPYTRNDVLGNGSLESLLSVAKDNLIRLIVFRHSQTVDDRLLQVALLEFQAETDCILNPIQYSSGLEVFEFSSDRKDVIAKIASFPGARDLRAFPKYKVVKTSSRNLGSAPKHSIPLPESGVIYPVVGQIDTGIGPKHPILTPWIEDRWDAVPIDEQNHDHGSFVAGLICGGKSLNHDDNRFPSTAAKIVDVVAFDKNGNADENTLLRIIRQSISKYPHVKVWNLSFSISDNICCDETFSPFGIALAEIANENKVIFVIAAGNTDRLRAWPRIAENENDRICSPADSPTGLVVGSVSHRDSHNSCVRENEPSPFSRRGPGAAYLMAPHLSHIGGNCDPDGQSIQMGVVSLDGHGNLIEDIGTSFAAPPVSSLIATVRDDINSEARPDILAKALILHSTLLNNTNISPTHLNHVGLGTPPDIDEIIHCRQSSATIVFEADLSNEPNFIKEHFPIPSCLVSNGSLNGEIIMSLAYSPPLNPNSGVECCQTNVSASLGTLHPTKNGFGYEIDTFPKKLEGRFEQDLIKHGYKWSPFKFYRRKFNRKNTLGNRRWELRLKIERRSSLPVVPEQHYAYVLVTIRSIETQDTDLKIYDEIVVEMDRLGWGATDLQVQTRTRATG